MRTAFFMICLSCFFAQASPAQSPSISLNESPRDHYCVGQKVRIPVTVTGSFQEGNLFSVKISYYARGENQVKALPASIVNGYLEFLLDEKELVQSPGVQLKVVTTSPATETGWSNYFRVFGSGSVTLKAVSDTLNMFEDIRLQFLISAMGQTDITMNDSTKFSYSNYYESSYTGTATAGVARNSGTFKIAYAKNECGSLAVGGEARIVVNPVSILPAPLDKTICQDSEFRIRISSDRALPGGAKYRVRFVEQYYYGSNSGPRTIETNATLEGQVLKGRFPERSDIPGGSNFLVQVIQGNPGAVSALSQDAVSVYPKPEAIFTSASTAIAFGQSADLQISVGGAAPAQVELSDGTVASNQYYTSIWHSVRPTHTTTYSIKSFSTGCGQGNSIADQKLVVTVKPGIDFDFTGDIRLCENQKTRLPVKHNLNISSGTTIFLEAAGSENRLFRFPAKLMPDGTLEVDIPSSPGNSSYFLSDLYGFRIVIPDLDISSNYNYGIRIQGKPFVISAGTDTPLPLDKPGLVHLTGRLAGGAPYTLNVNGETKVIEGNDYVYSSVYVKEDTEFIYGNIRNECFSNPENRFGVSLKVSRTNQAPHVYIYDRASSNLCPGDSLEIEFDGYGQFGDGNKFIIQYEYNGSYHAVQTVGSAGKYKFKVPDITAQNYWTPVRVSSTNPVLFSSTLFLKNSSLPSGIYHSYSNTSENKPAIIYPGEGDITISGGFSGNGPATIVFSDDTGDREISVYDNYFRIPVFPETGKNDTYTIKSITNACGTTNFNAKIFLRKNAYQIALTQPNRVFCGGDAYDIYFLSGKEKKSGPATEYILQVAPSNSAESFTELARTTSDSKFSGVIPSRLAQGYYVIRVLSSDGVFSEPTNMQIFEPPKATLSTDFPLNQGVAELSSRQSIELKMDLTGSGSIYGVFSEYDQQVYSFYSGLNYLSFRPERSQTYKVYMIRNLCGYGSGTGEVRVKVKPALQLTPGQQSICEGGNFQTGYAVLGDAELGPGDYLVFRLQNSADGSIVPIDSTRNLKGNMNLKIPSPLAKGPFSLQAVIKKYNLLENIPVSITIRPDITLTGNSTINSGGSTRLILKNNNSSSVAYSPTTFTVLDNTTGEERRYDDLSGIYVSPPVTTTYTLKSVSNSCGEGKASGQAIVVVNPPSDKTISTINVSPKGWNFCMEDTVTVYFSSSGAFSSSNKFVAQISDENGTNFRDIPTIGAQSPLQVVLPGNLSEASLYRIRITATDPGTASGAWQEGVTPSRRSSARFLSDRAYFENNKPAKLVVALEGSPPWYYIFGTDLAQRSKYAYASPDTLTIDQASPSLYYKLYSVQNNCGSGTVSSPSTVRVQLIMATEPDPLSDIKIGPNPAHDYLNIYFGQDGMWTISLYDLKGIPILTRQGAARIEQLDMTRFPGGIYIMNIETGGKKQSFRIVKE